MFITALTTARHLPLSCARSIQSIPPHTTSWKSISISFSHLRLGLPSGHFPQVSPPKPCKDLSCLRFLPYVPPISLFLNARIILLSSTHHKAPFDVVFSTLVWPRPSQAQLPYSAPHWSDCAIHIFTVSSNYPVSGWLPHHQVPFTPVRNKRRVEEKNEGRNEEVYKGTERRRP